MSQINKATSACLLFLSVTAVTFAETDPKPMAPMGNMPMNQGMGMQHGMGMGMNMTEEQLDQHLRAYQEHLLQMHDLSNQILSEKDPQKKEQLKTKQLELMKTHHEQMMEHRMQKRMQHQQMPSGESKGGK